MASGLIGARESADVIPRGRKLHLETRSERVMRVIIKPSLTPHLHLDLTNALVSTIAHELSRVQGGNDVLNWLEAERTLRDLLAGATGAGTPGRRGGASQVEPRPERRTRRTLDFNVSPRIGDEPERSPMSATRG